MRNSFLMMLEQIIRISIGITIGMLVAKHMGPENYGVISYALALMAIFMPLGRLGMESILVRELSQNKSIKSCEKLIGAAFFLMFFSGLGSYIFMLLIASFLTSNDSTAFYLVILGLAIPLQSINVIDYYAQSKLNLLPLSIIKIFSIILSGLIKIYLIHINADVIYFVISFSLDYIIPATLILLYSFWKGYHKYLCIDRKNENEVMSVLMKSAYPMTVSALGVILYMRSDQLLINHFLTSKDLGVYSAMARIYEGWLLLPYILSISLLPFLAKLKNKNFSQYIKSIKIFIAGFFWIPFLLAIVFLIYSFDLVELILGVEYTDGVSVLSIMFFTASISSLNSILVRFLTIEGEENLIAKRTGFSLIINVLIGVVLIPIFGILGAAVSGVISNLSTFLFMIFTSKGRDVLKIMLSAITFNFYKKDTLS